MLQFRSPYGDRSGLSDNRFPRSSAPPVRRLLTINERHLSLYRPNPAADWKKKTAGMTYHPVFESIRGLQISRLGQNTYKKAPVQAGVALAKERRSLIIRPRIVPGFSAMTFASSIRIVPRSKWGTAGMFRIPEPPPIAGRKKPGTPPETWGAMARARANVYDSYGRPVGGPAAPVMSAMQPATEPGSVRPAGGGTNWGMLIAVGAVLFLMRGRLA